VTYISATRTVDNFLSKSDLQRLQQIFNDGIKSNDLQTIYYSVINSKKIPTESKESLCKKLPGLYKDSKLNVCICLNYHPVRLLIIILLSFSRILRRIITMLAQAQHYYVARNSQQSLLVNRKQHLIRTFHPHKNSSIHSMHRNTSIPLSLKKML
jgi:hypothetical protein